MTMVKRSLRKSRLRRLAEQVGGDTRTEECTGADARYARSGDTDEAAPRKAMRYIPSPRYRGLLVLFGCATTPRPIQPTDRDAYPEEQGVVCAVKAGDRQNYWPSASKPARAARRRRRQVRSHP